MAIGPVLEGEGVCLRPVTATDVGPEYVGWLNDPEVNRYLESRHDTASEGSVGAFVAKTTASERDYLFAICRKQGGRHIGNVRLGPVRAPHGLAEISLYIGDRSAWGEGHGRETIALITRFAFEDQGLNKVMGRIYAANEASIRVFLRAGWKEEARLADHYLFDGAPMDMVFVGCTARDYAARRRR